MEFLDLENIDKQFCELKKNHLIRETEYNSLLNRQFEHTEQKTEIEVQSDIFEKVKLLLSETTKFVKSRIIEELEDLVSTGLQFIFEEYMEFVIDTESSIKFMVMTDGHEIDPEEAMGGGVVDIISIILRFAILQSYSPELIGPFILDEPAKMVSNEYIPKLSQFLQQLNKQFQRQIIMCTHDITLANIADTLYLVKKENSISHVSKIENSNLLSKIYLSEQENNCSKIENLY